jgi:hypothetical protein
VAFYDRQDGATAEYIEGSLDDWFVVRKQRKG